MVSEARAGDITVHYRSGHRKSVVAISRALADPVEGMIDLKEFRVNGTVCWQKPGHGWRFEARYHDLKEPILKSLVIEELSELEIEDGPIESPGRIRQGYFMRFSVGGLRVLRRASEEAWPDWAEAALSSHEATARYYFYNTDGKSLGEPRPRFHTLIDNRVAATGGERRFGEKLGQLAPHDTLLMYENGIGVVAVGTVMESWDGRSHRDLLYYKSTREIGKHGHEYRIAVDWFLDLTDDPIGIAELKDRLGYLPRGTIKTIVSDQAEVARMIEERLRGRQAAVQTPTHEIGKSVLAPPGRVESVITRIIRDTAEARRLKELYESRCQICGERIELGPGTFYAEVHHIRPLGGSHRGLDSHDNMLVVCPTHHAMLDLGVATFSSECCVCIGARPRPLTLKHRLAPENLDYHNEGIARFCGGGRSADELGRPLGSPSQ